MLDEGLEKTKEIKKKIAESTNYFGFIIMIAVYFAFSILGNSVNPDGVDMLKSYTALDWTIFVLKPLLTATMGAIAKSFLKKQGAKDAFKHEDVAPIYKEWQATQSRGKEEEIPEDYRKVMAKGSIKSSLRAAAMTVVTALVITLISIDFSVTNVLSLFVTLSLWIGFGFIEYGNTYDYIIEKQTIRMRYEIKQNKEDICQE